MSRILTWDKWLERLASLLSQKSLINLTLCSFRFKGKYPFDDRTVLHRHPLEIFFYNLRAILLVLFGIFVLSLFVLIHLLDSNEQMRLMVHVLSGMSAAAIMLTLMLHGPLKNRIDKSLRSPNTGDVLISPYFILDFCLLFILVVITRWFNLRLYTFEFLLFLNAIVSGSSISGMHRSMKILIAIILLMPLLPLALMFGLTLEVEGPRWFYGLLYAGPSLSLWIMTITSLLMMSWLKNTGYRITQHHLALLGKYEEILSRPTSTQEPNRLKGEGDHLSEKEFHKQVVKVLEDLCTLGPPFWYHSGCLWIVEKHQDRGDLFLPGPRYRFKEAKGCANGINMPEGLLSIAKSALLPSIKHRSLEWEDYVPEFRAELDAPAAFIPLRRDGNQIGTLALYGEPGGPIIQPQEEAFLRSLGSIISNTLEQWEGRYRDVSQAEMDGLFKCRTLDEVFSKAVRILKAYLTAEGCMVIFRPDPERPHMEISAKDGFTDIIYKNSYEVGVGQTGKCAQLGEPIRCDDMSNHTGEFDSEYLEYLIKAHGKPIHSWMAIPIGLSDRNFGVIQVVNRTFRCSWFTDADQKIGEALALRLQVIVEKFRQLKEIEDAMAQAELNALESERHAEDALQAKLRAEAETRQRQQDLMTITHQLQGPLIPVIGTISHVMDMHPPKQMQRAMGDAQALAYDAMTLCYGIVTTFAQEAGQETSFFTESIDAPAEMQKLSKRLQMTNSREDLTFTYRQDPDFPILRMDRSVFTSVLFSLIHNAMKYAEETTTVILECSFERNNNEAALKVKSAGVRIFPQERELIFQKFKRGQAVERGRHHSGVGLGLWVARQLMREVGGDLTVELPYSHPDLSVFVVHFPASAR